MVLMALALIASEKRTNTVMKQKYCFYLNSEGSLEHYQCDDESGTGGETPTGGAGGSNIGGI